MGKGILHINADIIAEWFIAGKTKDDVKTLLKLPGHYEINDVTMSNTGLHSCIVVSSPDIPEVEKGTTIPEIVAKFTRVGSENGRWHLPESYKLTDLKAIVPLSIENKVSSQENDANTEETSQDDIPQQEDNTNEIDQ